MNENSSSSEDELITEALKEATDHHFLKESLFVERSSDDKNSKKDTKTCQQKSLRPHVEGRDEFNIFGVSDHFQCFVAKNLSKLLDKNIKFVGDPGNYLSTPMEQESNLRGGIRLLSTFNVFVSDEELNDVENIKDLIGNKKRRKPSLLKKDVSIPCKIKFQEAAVDPEWILSKCDTKAWVNKRKEADFKYKMSQDGTIIEEKN